jgi:hypothetical protein
MKSVPRVRRLRWLRAFLLLFLPGLAAAQTIPYTANGVVSITGLGPIYNGKYVIKQSDFGFFWLDTSTLTPGHVQAESKCTGFQPPSDTLIYVIGDCNGITSVSSSGVYVLVRQLNGNCGAAVLRCNGPRDDGNTRFTFAVGSFDYLGDLGEIPDSTQTTDPQGRTWTIQPTDATGLNFVWTSSGVPNSPPVAAAFATNLSAASRNDKTNYYGDRWQLQDASSGGPTSITWDFNYAGFFGPDESGPAGSEAVVIGYFPCDPSGGVPGNIRNGASCLQSLGLTNPPASATYEFAMRSTNQFGTSANTFVSAPQAFTCPQAVIAGYANFTGTCSKTGGTLTVPSGGNADASSTKGNVSDAVFSWGFTFPAGPPAAAQGVIVPVPNGANGFSLTVAFPGGYQVTASGAIAFIPSLTPTFTTENPVVRGSSFVVINQMEKASTTTLNSVDSLITPGACGTPPPIPTNPMPASFLVTGGTASLTAPNVSGGYCLYLQYNFTQGTTPASSVGTHGLTVVEWSPRPMIGVFLDSARTKPAPFAGTSFFLAAGTTYYLYDQEPAPPPGVAYPGAQWSLLSPSGAVSLGSASDQSVLPAVLLKACPSVCAMKLSVGGAAQQIPANVSSCAPGATTLCVNGSRFAVGVTWATPDGNAGAGQAVSLTSDTGYFWFFTPNNVEMVAKVVDGRALNGSFWVFAGGLTNVDALTTVIDTTTGAVRTYRNPQGTPFQPIQDSNAFPAATTPQTESRLEDTDDSASENPGLSTLDLRPSLEAAACSPNATTLCLNNGRFQVQTQWTTPDGRNGPGQAASLTGDTGYFWFFTSNNVEMVVKAVNGCGFNASYWVFAGGLTNVNVVTTVTDTQTGAVRTYTNPQNTAFQPLQDTSAFATCP